MKLRKSRRDGEAETDTLLRLGPGLHVSLEREKGELGLFRRQPVSPIRDADFDDAMLDSDRNLYPCLGS